MSSLTSQTPALNALTPKRRAKPRRHARRRSVKTHRSYTIAEASRATGYAKGTIARWVKSRALPAMRERKPFLILGTDLAAHLKNAHPRTKLKLHECFCLKCKLPRGAAGAMADYVPMTAATGNLKALCSACGTVMHKAISKATLMALAQVLDVAIQQAPEHLIDTTSPSSNDTLAKEAKNHA